MKFEFERITGDGNCFKVVNNDDDAIFFKEWWGLFVNGELNLIAPVDVHTVLDGITKFETGAEIKAYIEENTWTKSIDGVL